MEIKRERTYIFGMGVDTYTRQEVIDKCMGFVYDNKRDCKMIVTPNPEMAMLAREKKSFLDIMNNADLVLCDGVGIYLAAKLNKIKIPERVQGCNLCFSLFEIIKDKPVSVYLLGAKPGIALNAKKMLAEQYKGINITGARDGYFKDDEDDKIIEEINRLKPDILMVGLGFPRQEEWLYRYKNKLNVNVAIAVGGSIDIMAGNVKRAPQIFQKTGMEWFYRLVSQPSRFVRMLKLPQFVIVFLMSKIFRSAD
ncbi:MAG: WecB/TagA/CpsF family glycosyltransferase [Clostridiales bacterium]|jgi:N-acetylglucosaminyldiphosphoundecaprenol N-acetyl-beta-D-mannosaminyltransferase|nr:WecB/TagA/CpsF family glycosyltransferase [Clostridiales bacterium]